MKKKKSQTTQRSQKKSKPITNQIICTSGFSPEENEEIIKQIKQAGGQYTENLKIDTNYLIASTTCSTKALFAQNMNIKIVTREWIDPTNEKYLNPKDCLIKCFEGVKFFLFGFDTAETLPLMKKTIRANGGHIKSNYAKCDVILFKSGVLLTEQERNEFMQYESKIVTDEWYTNCIRHNKFLPLDGSKFNLNNDIIATRYNSLLDEVRAVQDYSDNKRYNLFLGKVFYISPSFDKNTKNKISFAVSVYHGLVYNNVSPLTNYIICLNKKDMNSITQEITDYSDNNQPRFVTYDFVFDSGNEGVILDTRKYKPLSSIRSEDEDDEDDDDDDDSSSECDLNKENKKRKGKRKKAVLSTIFRDETFTIITETYTPEQIAELKEKIIQNSGTIIEKKGTEKKGKHIVMNDGYGPLMTCLLNSLREGNEAYCIVSHRFIDKCIEEQELVQLSDYLHLVPFNSVVPIESFTNLEFYLYKGHFSINDTKSIEELIETLGGSIDLSPKTTHILVSKPIRKKDFESLKKKSNSNIKLIKDDWFLEFLCSFTLPDESKFSVDIID